MADHPLRPGRDRDRQRRQPLRRRERGRLEGHLRAQGPQDRQGVGGRRRPGGRQEDGAGGLQGQARRQPEISHRSGPPGPGAQEQPVRLQFGPAQGGTGRSVEALCQRRSGLGK